MVVAMAVAMSTAMVVAMVVGGIVRKVVLVATIVTAFLDVEVVVAVEAVQKKHTTDAVKVSPGARVDVETTRRVT